MKQKVNVHAGWIVGYLMTWH